MKAAPALLAGLAALALPAPALADPFLSREDAAELAQSLAEAREEQDVCYGWEVRIQDDSGGPSGLDVGSSGGPGVPLATDLRCRSYVVLRGSVHYTCDSCEPEDSSEAEVVTNLRDGPSTEDLEDLGLEGGDLKDDDGDSALSSMVGALPLIAASSGVAPPIAAERDSTPSARGDEPTGSPWMPDWLRENWLALAACLALAGGGIFWLVSVVNEERRKARYEEARESDDGDQSRAADDDDSREAEARESISTQTPAD